MVRSSDAGGYGLDAQWSDDFHHAVHTFLTGERAGYYEDFGGLEDVAKALSNGFVYSGQYSRHRGRCHGTDCTDIPGEAFVVCIQNHDQIGNRMLGERLSHSLDFDQLKTAAAILLLSPYVPLIFMGQEYAETSPFLYFVSHSDPDLVAAVREGRKREFAAFTWKGEVPDAQEESTFAQSKLNHNLRAAGRHAALLEWHRMLLQMRASHPALKTLNRPTTSVEITGDGHTILMRRWSGDNDVMALFHMSKDPAVVRLDVRQQHWVRLLDGSDPAWMGNGSTVPESISAQDGQIQMALGPFQCVVLSAS
jgi:maltooligosyltrehalose trehalohydrolase